MSTMKSSIIKITFAGNVEAAVHPINVVNVSGAWSHEHCAISCSLLLVEAVRGLVRLPRVHLCLDDAAPEYLAVQFSTQHLSEQPSGQPLAVPVEEFPGKALHR